MKDPGDNRKVTADSRRAKEEKHRKIRQNENRNRAWGREASSIPGAFFSSRWRKEKFIQLPGESGEEKKKEQPTCKRVNFVNSLRKLSGLGSGRTARRWGEKVVVGEEES